jgi:hypothetical protein
MNKQVFILSVFGRDQTFGGWVQLSWAEVESKYRYCIRLYVKLKRKQSFACDSSRTSSVLHRKEKSLLVVEYVQLSKNVMRFHALHTYESWCNVYKSRGLQVESEANPFRGPSLSGHTYVSLLPRSVAAGPFCHH